MSKFTVTCFCKKTDIKFYSPANYGGDIIARVYCPLCSDRAPEEALMIRVDGVPRHNGLYGIDWNQGTLKYLDPSFKDLEDWYRNFFGKKKLIFDFINPRSKKPQYEILGIRETD